jgi:hypothetical protein
MGILFSSDSIAGISTGSLSCWGWAALVRETGLAYRQRHSNAAIPGSLTPSSVVPRRQITGAWYGCNLSQLVDNRLVRRKVAVRRAFANTKMADTATIQLGSLRRHRTLRLGVIGDGLARARQLVSFSMQLAASRRKGDVRVSEA